MKKKVIAYLHSHWDREWYREFEVFRLRLIRVFDNVIDLLVNDRIPSFYFDGQVAALLDYLEFRPENEQIIRRLIKEKKLFIGPFYCLIDEFLTDRTCFEKNIEIGLKIAKDFGCEDFIGYFADTFGHSQNASPILKKYGIDKIMVWRGVPDLPSEFVFCGVNTVNLVRGYFMDIFSSPISIEDKAEWLKNNLDKIAEKSSDTLLLPIGADHLGIEKDISEQIENVNKLLEDYEIKLSNPFEYFELVKDNFKIEWNEELRDNSKTFILPGAYSARMKLKQLRTETSYRLEQADKLQKACGDKYEKAIEYAYKLLLQNQAHDSICGCSTDDVHLENITRYKKIQQIADTIIEELKINHEKVFQTIKECGYEFKSPKKLDGFDTIEKSYGFDNNILYNTQKIPVTEDYREIYTLKKSTKNLPATDVALIDSHLKINNITIEFVRFKDDGDTYNFGPLKDDPGEFAKIQGFQRLENGSIFVKTDFFDVLVNRSENLYNFKITWENNLTNRLWQVKLNLPNVIYETFSEDLDSIIKREFEPEYDMRKHLPQTRGIETKTNFAPMQRYVGAQGVGIITKGLTEYEVRGKSILITLLRSVGVISNPHNPARSTPAGPPIEVPDAQQLGENTAEFSIGFFEAEDYQKYVDEVYPQISL
mgnify:FL=1